MRGKVRIIGGEWRSRQVQFEDLPGLRPTPARVRETLFNWLRHDVQGSCCLDLYSGSGAIGFEAASRGAKRVVLVDSSLQACQQLKINSDTLAAKQVTVVQQDVFRFLAGDAEAFDLVFLDPPFGRQFAEQTCHWLEDKDWLTQQAKVYLEVEKNLQLKEMPENWRQLKYKTAGEVGYYLYERSSSREGCL